MKIADSSANSKTTVVILTSIETIITSSVIVVITITIIDIPFTLCLASPRLSAGPKMGTQRVQGMSPPVNSSRDLRVSSFGSGVLRIWGRGPWQMYNLPVVV